MRKGEERIKTSGERKSGGKTKACGMGKPQEKGTSNGERKTIGVGRKKTTKTRVPSTYIISCCVLVVPICCLSSPCLCTVHRLWLLCVRIGRGTAVLRLRSRVRPDYVIVIPSLRKERMNRECVRCVREPETDG